MGRMVKVRAWRANGTPLLADFEEDEPAGYRRALIGFGTEVARDEYLGRSRDERPSLDVQPLEEAEGIFLFEEKEEGEEEK